MFFHWNGTRYSGEFFSPLLLYSLPQLATHKHEHAHTEPDGSHCSPPRSRLPQILQLPRPRPAPVVGKLEENGKEGKKKKKKKRARSEDDDGDDGGASTAEMTAGVEAGADDGDKAARVYQAWLEARYLDLLRVMLGWVAEVDDFHRQVTRLTRALIQKRQHCCVFAIVLSLLTRGHPRRDLLSWRWSPLGAWQFGRTLLLCSEEESRVGETCG